MQEINKYFNFFVDIIENTHTKKFDLVFFFYFH